MREDLAPLAGRQESVDEIEQSIVSAAYTAFSQKKPLETAHILDEVAGTRPLAVLRAEEVAALRDWADGRTVPSD